MTSEKRRQFQVSLAFALVYVLWGATYLAMRIAVVHIPPFVMGALRYGVAGPLMLAYCALVGKKVSITRQDGIRLLAIGILLLSVANMGVATAEQYVPSGLAALIVAGVPIWVAILEAWVFRSRRLSALGLAGLALGVVGMVVLMWPRISAARLDRLEWAGFGILLIASASWALGSVLSGRWKMTVDVFTASAWEMTFAGIINGLVALVTGGFHRVTWTPSGLLAILFLVICGSWIGFTAYIWLLEHVPTPRVATYAYVNPVVAVYLGWLILNEKVDAFMLLGTVIIISAVALVNLSKLRALKGARSPEAALPACETAGD